MAEVAQGTIPLRHILVTLYIGCFPEQCPLSQAMIIDHMTAPTYTKTAITCYSECWSKWTMNHTDTSCHWCHGLRNVVDSKQCISYLLVIASGQLANSPTLQQLHTMEKHFLVHYYTGEKPFWHTLHFGKFCTAKDQVQCQWSRVSLLPCTYGHMKESNMLTVVQKGLMSKRAHVQVAVTVTNTPKHHCLASYTG